jgi:hypothetical protein
MSQGLPSCLQPASKPIPTSFQGLIDISNIWISSQTETLIPVSTDFSDATTYKEASDLRSGDTNWDITIPSKKTVFLEGGVYIRSNLSAFRIIACGLRLFKNGSAVRSVGMYTGANVTDTLAMRCSTIIDPDEADEVRMLVGRGSGTGNISFSGGSDPYYGGWWKLISY